MSEPTKSDIQGLKDASSSADEPGTKEALKAAITRLSTQESNSGTANGGSRWRRRGVKTIKDE